MVQPDPCCSSESGFDLPWRAGRHTEAADAQGAEAGRPLGEPPKDAGLRRTHRPDTPHSHQASELPLKQFSFCFATLVLYRGMNER